MLKRPPNVALVGVLLLALVVAALALIDPSAHTVQTLTQVTWYLWG